MADHRDNRNGGNYQSRNHYRNNNPNRSRASSGRPDAKNSGRPSNAPPRPRHRASAQAGRSKRRTNYAVTAVAIIAFLVLCSYFIRWIYTAVNEEEVPATVVQMGSVDMPVVLSGIIVRDETVYKSPIEGVVNFFYNDLDKVRKSDEICAIQDETTAAQAESDLNRLNENILKMQNMRGDISQFKKDVDAVNAKIKGIVDTKGYLILDEDISAVYDLKNSIEQKINLRNQMLLNDDQGSLSGLASQKQQFQQQYDSSLTKLYAGSGGILSYITDGQEEALTVDNLDSITPEQTRQNVSYESLGNSRSVEKDTAVFKIVESNDWYIASYIPNDYSFDWVTGDARTIYIQQGDASVPFTFTVDRLEKGAEDTYVVLKAEKSMLDYLHMRSVKFKVTDSEHIGYKVPNTAIVNKTYFKIPLSFVDEGGYVLKLTGETQERTQVDIEDEDETHVYILQDFAKMKLNDVLKSPVNGDVMVVEEAEAVKGVYVINSGYAKFVRVVTSDESPATGEYSVLAVDENTGLKLYDRIVTDAKNVEQGQQIGEF